MSSSLSDRYRTTTSLTTKLLLGLGFAILVVLIGWLCWAVWFHGHSKVVSDLGVNTAIDANHYKVNVDITLAHGVKPSSVSCLVSAIAKDGSTAGGPLDWHPTKAGGNVFIIKTVQRAVYLDWEGCRAPGQDDYR